VGTTYIDPDDSWSLSWTITTADLPAGTQSGDLLLLWLIADTASGSSTFAPTGGWSLSGDWTLVRDQRSGGTTQGYVGCFRSTYVSGALPQTLVPKSSTGTTIDRSSVSGANWYGILMAYRPSATFSADGGYSSTLTATTVYGGSGATQVFPDGVAGGTTVGVAATTGAAPTLSTTADFTEQTSGALVDWRSGVSCVGYIESATLGNYIWVGGTDVLKFDPATLEPVAFYDGTITNTFYDLAFDGQSSPGLWFSNSVDVRKLDLSSGTFSSPVTVGNGPRAMTFGAGSVWVGHINDNTIKRIDPATQTVTATITLAAGGRSEQDAIFAAGYAWFCAYGSGRVFKVDPATNTATEITNFTRLTTGLGYDGTKIWVVDDLTGAIWTIDPSTNAVTKRTATSFFTSSPYLMAWDGSYMWVGEGTNVKRIDPATYTVAATVAVGSAAGQMAYMLGYLYVGDDTANVVRKIDVTTDTVVDTYDTDLAKVRGGYSHIDREFVSAYSGTKPQWTKSNTVYGAAVFAAFGPGVVPTADQWGMNVVRW
jgi:DNA-binding beta-propeller fold protein YncE